MTASGPQVLWTSDEVAAATGGRATRDFRASGVAIDSRTVKSGDLFVAIVGPNFDGHDYVVDALRKGAVGAVVHRRPANLTADVPVVETVETLAALRGLGAAARARGSARIVAITGSVGKTGTKEALRLVLAGQGATTASEGSLNNHWGLPLSLARMPRDVRFGVFELGMNHPGEILPLSHLARPHVAVITTIAAVHSAHFDNEGQIADAKAEIFSGMTANGIAVLNRDNEFFDRLAASARAQAGCRVLGFGRHLQADVRFLSAELGGEGSLVHASLMGAPLSYRLAVAGEHWVMNSLAVLAAVQALGADVPSAARALAQLQAPAGRGQRQTLQCPGGTFLLIDESYNASPISVKAALAVLGRIEPGRNGRRIAVLGDMLELGADSAQRHAVLAGPLRDAGIDLVFAAGAHMESLWQAVAPAQRGGHAADAAALSALVADAVRPGDAVMVKGSHGSRMATVVAALKSLGGKADRPLPLCAVSGG